MNEQRETVLRVDGMTCGGCTRHVGNALNALAGVEVVEVRLGDGRVRVRHDSQSSVDAMLEALRKAGYEGALAA